MALSATHRLRPRSRLVAALSLVGVLALGALSARPDWHEAICHHHAHGAHHAHTDTCGDDGDGCIVTLFATGQLLAGLTVPLSVTVIWQCLATRPATTHRVATPDHALAPSRGPPVR